MAKWLEKEVVSTIEGIPPIEEWQSASCSVCGRYHTTPYMYFFKEDNYCPHCGAAMDGEAMNGEDTMLKDGTLIVTVDDATKVGRVLVQDDQNRGGLYYADEVQIDCETCRHKHDGTIGCCKTCGESNYEPKDEPQTDCQWK